MNPPAHTDVAVDVLVRNAQRRYEDSYAYHALYQFLLDVAAVPHWAWGDLPWSRDWRRGWEEACEHRIAEARDIRDATARTGGQLCQVAANYTTTELEVALTFTRVDPDTGEAQPAVTNRDTAVYLDHYRQGLEEVRAAPGGDPPEPEFPERPAGSPFSAGHPLATPADERVAPSGVEYPADHAELQALLREEPPAGMTTWMGEGESGFTFSVQEEDELQRFVEEYGPDLAVMEKDMLAVAPEAPRPWSEYIRPAWLSFPSIIENRANLMRSVGNTHDELLSEWRADTDALSTRWDGEAAGSYIDFTRSLERHAQQLAERAHDLAEQGVLAAQVLSRLRIACAEAGYGYIQLLLRRHEEYVASMTEPIARVASCTTPEGAQQAFVQAVQDFASQLADERRRKADEATPLLGPAAVAADGPTFGRELDRVSRPVPIVGYDEWGDVSQW